MKKYECHIISNTHWDREWVKSFQETRLNLIDMFDKLFKLIEENPEFKHYHLDSQTIPLEDYLEFRPENESLLKDLISKKKLLVGPWYSLPEMNSIDGECIVRNLLIGHKVAKRFGHVTKVGYTPTSTGQISQLPQIYKGFGVNTIIFYRGVNQDVAPAEYIWKSPDGTESVAIRPPQHFSRCTFWGYVYLPLIHKYYDHIEGSKQNYWEDGGFLFRLAHENENEFIELEPHKYFDKDYINEALNRLLGEVKKHTNSNVLLSLHGHDASYPHEETPALIIALNEASEDTLFIHSSLEVYSEKIQEAIRSGKNNKVLEGEMRFVNQSQPWNDAHLYPGVISTKGRLKRRNRSIENLLIRHAEPASTMACMIAGKYEKNILEYAWKLVIANHAHDTINACSLDAVYFDAMHRIDQAEDLCMQVLKRSLAHIVSGIRLDNFADESVFITLFNLSPKNRSSALKLVIDMPLDSDTGNYELVGPEGEKLPLQVSSINRKTLNVDKVGFGKTHHSKRVIAWTTIHDIVGGGYSTFLVKKIKSDQPTENIASGNTMENEFLVLTVNADGSLRVKDKDSQKIFDGLNVFIDEGESGNAWTPQRIPGGVVISSKGHPTKIELIENGPVKATFRVLYTMMLPVSSANNYAERSQELTEVTITSEISLFMGIKYILIESSLDNNIKDHRLRVHFPSDISSGEYFAAMPYDVVKRPVPKPRSENWTEPVEPSDPQTGFIGIEDDKAGLAILNQGLYEAEVLDNDERSIAITLLRSFYQHGNWTKDRWNEPEFQNPGSHKFVYAICPYQGTWSQAGIPDSLEQIDNPIIPVQHGKGTKGYLPLKNSFISLSGRLQTGCVKNAEDGTATVLRLYNPTPQDENGVIRFSKNIVTASLTDMEENESAKLSFAENKVDIIVPHHKIVTIKIAFQ